jgi:hypothetical protein
VGAQPKNFRVTPQDQGLGLIGLRPEGHLSRQRSIWGGCLTPGPEDHNYVQRMAIEVSAATVVERRDSWILVASGNLNISERNARIERRHENGGLQHVW